ncbi:MAG TPA: M36 family metallopeptidase [Baekduia sp.]|nr:M36 family metallopeptidase [Baekduia sp.]
MGRCSRLQLAGLLTVVASTLALSAAAAALAVAPAQTDARPDFDARAGDRADVPAATTDARTALSKQLGAQATVSADPVTGGLRTIVRTDGFLTGPSAADPSAIALGYARDHAAAFGLDPADLATLKLATRTTSPDGVTHLTFQQRDDGVAAYDSALTASVTADGRLVATGGAPVHDLQPPSTDPPLGPGAARAAAQRDLGLTPDGAAGTVGTDAARTTTFAGTGDVASLTTLADPDGDRLAWKLTVAGAAPYVYEVLIDAATGAILTRHSLTDFAASNATVHELHPGDGSDHAQDLAAWITTPTRLAGPNVHAYADRSPPDGITGDSEVGPSSGTDFDFPVTGATPASGQSCPSAFTITCTWNGATAASATPNVGQVTTQVFYYLNKYHDWLAQSPVGFTPSSYNFEGADAVNAETDDYSGVNNSNMTTPPDGQPGKLQLYLFAAPYPAVNGGDDATVVYHEYTHGLTNRLVGNDGQANGLLARQSQAMGEGWSDWYALDYLTAQGQLTDTATPGEEVMGAYVTDDTDTGIRYNAIDCPVGSTDAVHCPGTTLTGPGGFTFGDLGRVLGYSTDYPVFEVHADGEIWAETLWDLRRAVGATPARSLITSALRLSPKQPTFLDMRDAILAADTVAGGANRAAIWSVFAARGMGYSASVTSANATHAHEAFDLPPLVAGGAPSATAAALEQDTPVSIPLVNPGTTALTNVHATLSSATSGITVPGATADLGTIAANGTASAAFSVHAAAAAGCGTVGALTLTVSSDQGTRTIPYNLPLGTGSATTATRAYSTPAAIPNNAPASGLVSTVTVPTHGRVGHLRFTLAASHTWIGDLHATLTSPAGTTVDLFERPGVGTSTNYSAGNLVAATPLVLDDDATKPIQELASADATIGGLYDPNEALSRFAGEDRYGTWTLRITDSRAQDAGTVTSWSLATAAPACAITDAPTGLVDDAATFHARVDPGPASATTAAFELGATTAYGARSPAIALIANSGLQDITLSTPGLTPGATYHVRAVAMRNGAVIATGADRTFVAGADTPSHNGRNGGGDDGSGVGGKGGDGSGDGGAGSLTPQTPGASQPPQVFTVPKATMKGLAKSVRLDRKGRFVLSFKATPAKARGSIKLAYGKVGAGSASFTVPASGRVTLTIKASSKLRAALRKKTAGVKAKATMKLGVTTFSANLTIKPYKKPAQRK